MILTDSQIREALGQGYLTIDPAPGDEQYSTTALDFHIGDKFLRFRPDLYGVPGVGLSIDLDAIEIGNLRPYMEALPVEQSGCVMLRPKEFVIGITRERIELPARGRLAARVEGRSRYARLGLVVHMTAPTIHNGFSGQITLEIMNHGPIPLLIRPNVTRLCQLVFERVDDEPSRTLASPFQHQTDPLGSH